MLFTQSFILFLFMLFIILFILLLILFFYGFHRVSLGVFFIHAILHSKWVVAKLLYISMGRDGGVNTMGIESETSRTGESNTTDHT